MPLAPVQLISPSADSTARGTLPFKAGQVLSFRVAEARPDGTVRLVSGNYSLEASTQQPLKSGSTVRLEVASTANGLVLRPAGNGANPGAAQTGAAQTGAAQTGAAQTGASQTGTSPTSPSPTGAATASGRAPAGPLPSASLAKPPAASAVRVDLSAAARLPGTAAPGGGSPAQVQGPAQVPSHSAATAFASQASQPSPQAFRPLYVPTASGPPGDSTTIQLSLVNNAAGGSGARTAQGANPLPPSGVSGSATAAPAPNAGGSIPSTGTAQAVSGAASAAGRPAAAVPANPAGAASAAPQANSVAASQTAPAQPAPGQSSATPLSPVQAVPVPSSAVPSSPLQSFQLQSPPVQSSSVPSAAIPSGSGAAPLAAGGQASTAATAGVAAQTAAATAQTAAATAANALPAAAGGSIAATATSGAQTGFPAGAPSAAAAAPQAAIPASATAGQTAAPAAAASATATAAGAQAAGAVPVAAATPQAALAEAIHAALPRQDGLAGLFAAAGLAVETESAGTRLPNAVAEAARQILGLRLSANGLSGDKLAAAIKASGVFSESALAKGIAAADPATSAAASGLPGATPQTASALAATADLKASILLLRNLLGNWLGVSETGSRDPRAANRPAPPRKAGVPQAQAAGRAALPPGAGAEAVGRLLQERSEQALARIRLAQVASLPEGEEAAQARGPQTPQHWSVEIPIGLGRETRIVQMDIERDGKRPGASEAMRATTIRFSMDLGDAGPIHAHVSYLAGRVGVRVWAEYEPTAERIARYQGELMSALDGHGLQVEDMRVRSGHPHGLDAAGDDETLDVQA